MKKLHPPAPGRPRFDVERFGVRMSPFKAAILDMIEAVPNGVSSAELRKHLYPPEAARTRSLIRVHIHTINELLSETDWLIVSAPAAGRSGR